MLANIPIWIDNVTGPPPREILFLLLLVSFLAPTISIWVRAYLQWQYINTPSR